MESNIPTNQKKGNPQEILNLESVEPVYIPALMNRLRVISRSRQTNPGVATITNRQYLPKAKLAVYLDDRYLSREDTDFVELVKEDLDLFIGGRKNIPRVLLFPRVNSYLRLLIHKTAEEYDNLSSFSVGEGEARQTVVCFSSQLAIRESTDETMSGHRPPAMRGRGRAKYRDQNSPSPTPGHIHNKSYGDGRASPDTWYGDKQSQSQRPGDQGERLTAGRASPVAPGVDCAGVKDRQRKADRTRNRRPDVQVYVPRARRSHAGRGYDPGTEVQSPHTPGGTNMEAPRKVKQERELYVPKPRLPEQCQQRSQPVPSENCPISRGEAQNRQSEESGDWTGTSRQIPETHLSKKIKVQDKRELCKELDLNTGKSVDCSIPSHTAVSNNYTEEVDRENVNTSKQKNYRSHSENENEMVRIDFDITEPTSDTRTFSDHSIIDSNKGMEIEESEKDSILFDTCDKNFGEIETTIAEAIPKQDFGTTTGISKTDEMSQSCKISEDNVTECLEARTKVVDVEEIKDSAETSIKIVSSQVDTSHEMFEHRDDGVINSSSKDRDDIICSEKQDDTLEDRSCDSHAVRESNAEDIQKVEETFETMVTHTPEQSVEEKQEKVYDSIEDAFLPSDDDDQSDTTYPTAELTTENVESNSKQDSSSNQLYDEDKNTHQSVTEDKYTHQLVAEDKKVYDSIEDAFMPTDDDDDDDDDQSDTNYQPTELSAVDVKSNLKQDSSSNQSVDEDKNTHQSVAEDKNTHQSLAEDKNTHQSLAEDKNIVQSELEEPDEDSWDALYNEDGDCLDPDAMDELTKNVGKVTIEKSKKINYLEYQPKDKGNFDYTLYGHIIEIYDFPKEFVTRDLIMAFQSFMSRGFDLKWVDDTHALGIFSSKVAANDALDMIHPLVKVCSLAQASRQSREKARKCTEFLQPYKPRPETSAMAARRLVAGALGIATNVSREKRELERKQLKEAKEKRRKDRRNREDIWEFGRCAMDEET